MSSPDPTSPEQAWQAQQAAQRYGMRTDAQPLMTEQEMRTIAQQAMAPLGAVFPAYAATLESSMMGEYNDKLPAEAASLRQGLGTRQAPAPPGVNYPAIPHAQLHAMVTNNVNPAGIGQVGDTWINIGNDLTQFQDDIASAIANSEAEWTGTAAEGARKAVAELGNQAALAGQAAQLTGVLTHQQSAALANAKNSIPPPPNPPFDPTTAQQRLRTITDPLVYAIVAREDQAQAAAQNAAHQQAAYIVQQYDSTLSQTSANMPSFTPAPPVTAHGAGGPGGATSTSGAAALGGGGGYPGGPPAVGTPGHTSAAGYVPDAAEGYLPGMPTTGLPGRGNNAQNQDGGNAENAGFVAPIGGAPVVGLGADTPRGGSGFGSGGFGSGGAGSGPESGARSGAGAAAAENAAISRGAAVERAAPGAPGGMMPPGRGGRGGEDTEHKRASYLVEPDVNEIFGTSERTAPPVIGE